MEAPENTHTSFEHSIRLGVDIIETDVQMTKDGKIMVCHDHTFDRICEPLTIKHSKILHTLSTELPKLKANMPMHFSTHGQCYQRKEGEDSTFTPLDTMFQLIPKEQVIHIEIKNQESDKATREVVKIIQKHKRHSTTIIGNLNHRYNSLIRELDPKIPTFSSWNDALMVYFYYMVGLVPFI